MVSVLFENIVANILISGMKYRASGLFKHRKINNYFFKIT